MLATGPGVSKCKQIPIETLKGASAMEAPCMRDLPNAKGTLRCERSLATAIEIRPAGVPSSLSDFERIGLGLDLCCSLLSCAVLAQEAKTNRPRHQTLRVLSALLFCLDKGFFKSRHKPTGFDLKMQRD
jgi:hypothetical protein